MFIWKKKKQTPNKIVNDTSPYKLNLLTVLVAKIAVT